MSISPEVVETLTAPLAHNATGKCFYCDKPEESPRDGVCFDHRKCVICTHFMSGPETYACLKNGDQPTHARCLIASRPRSTSDNITVSREYLQQLNLARLLVMPEPGLNEESNVNAAALRTNTFIVEMSLEEQFLFMRRMEAIAAEVSILISANRKSIKEGLIEKSRETMEEVRNYRNAPKTAKPAPMIAGEARVTKAKQSPRDKAIAAMMAIGLTKEQAEKAVPLV